MTTNKKSWLDPNSPDYDPKARHCSSEEWAKLRLDSESVVISFLPGKLSAPPDEEPLDPEKGG